VDTEGSGGWCSGSGANSKLNSKGGLKEFIIFTFKSSYPKEINGTHLNDKGDENA
jgi:hypothetical protein